MARTTAVCRGAFVAAGTEGARLETSAESATRLWYQSSTMAGHARRAKARRMAGLVLLLCASGCIRRDGRNSDCRWPAESIPHPADARHLSADAEFAEDLAIRYADTHHGLRTPGWVSGEAYGAARDRCMATLFEQIAKTHGVPAANVASALGQNRARIDLAVNLPFGVLYCFLAAVAARWIWRRYPRGEHGWIPGFVMTLFLSLAAGAGSTMLGQMWGWLVETIRIGNGHMSYRAQRLWWNRNATVLFAGAVLVFWAAAAVAVLRQRTAGSGER
ncbi:MAG: hypothetical protein ACRD96_01335 [Bryobacteraceae bacterium]